MPAIRNFLDLSTGHLTDETREMLDSLNWRDWSLAPGGQTSYGWFIYADPDSKLSDSWEPNEAIRDEDMPADLWRCMAYARAHDCDYILFDADAPIDEHLPYYYYEDAPTEMTGGADVTPAAEEPRTCAFCSTATHLSDLDESQETWQQWQCQACGSWNDKPAATA